MIFGYFKITVLFLLFSEFGAKLIDQFNSMVIFSTV